MLGTIGTLNFHINDEANNSLIICLTDQAIQNEHQHSKLKPVISILKVYFLRTFVRILCPKPLSKQDF